MIRAALLFLLPTVLIPALPGPAAAQYRLGGIFTLPDSTTSGPTRLFSFSATTLDPRAASMGKTTVADLRGSLRAFNNPALLSGLSGFSGSVAVAGAIPPSTIDAMLFISRNSGEFINGSTLEEVEALLGEIRNDPSARSRAADALQRLLEVPRAMVEKTIGNPTAPRENGAILSFASEVRLGSFGFFLTGYGQTGFALTLGPVYGELVSILLETDFRNSDAVDLALTRLEGMTGQLIDPVSGEVRLAALPALTAVSFADLTAGAAYGCAATEALDLGVNLRLLNRRFSFDRVSAEDASGLADQLLSGMATGTTGLTADIGAVYRPIPNLRLGFSARNILPFTRLTSRFEAGFDRTVVRYERDSAGSIVTYPDGDTSLVTLRQRVVVPGVADLDLPLVLTAGGSWSPREELDVALEVADIAGQLSRFDGVFERISAGLEYRITTLGGNLVIPLRLGVAELQPTVGTGAGWGETIRLDLAYFAATLTGLRSYSAQIIARW